MDTMSNVSKETSYVTTCCISDREMSLYKFLKYPLLAPAEAAEGCKTDNSKSRRRRKAARLTTAKVRGD